MALKGFIQTLESALASSALLSLILVAAPQLATETQLDSRENLQQAIEVAELSDTLPRKPAQVDSELAPFVPPGLQVRTSVSYYQSKHRRIELSGGEENVTVPNSPFTEAQLFVDSNPSSNVPDLEYRFNGTGNAVEISAGYERIELPGYGNLTIEGRGQLDVSMLSYGQNRSSGTPQGTRFSASVFDTENGTREVVVEAWEE